MCVTLQRQPAKSCRTTEPRSLGLFLAKFVSLLLSFQRARCYRHSRVRGIYSRPREQRRPPRRISIAKLINPSSVFPGGHPRKLCVFRTHRKRTILATILFVSSSPEDSDDEEAKERARGKKKGKRKKRAREKEKEKEKGKKEKKTSGSAARQRENG